MKNRKFALQLSLEDDKELMDEIDALLRERARAIVREEAENVIGGSIRDEARRIIKAKIEGMRGYDLNEVIRHAVSQDIRYNSSGIREIVEKEFADFLNDEHNYFMQQMVKREVERYVNARLSTVVQSDVIKAVCDSLMKKK